MRLFGVSVVHDHQRFPVAQGASDVLQEQQRWAISPMGVVDHDHQGLLEGELTQQACCGVELAETILDRSTAVRRPIGVGEHLGCKAGQVDAQSVLLGESAEMRSDADGTQNLSPRPVRGRAGRVDRGPPYARYASSPRQPHQILGQSGLADARLTPTQDQARLTGQRRLQAVSQRGQFRLSTDQLRSHQRHVSSRRTLPA